MRSNQDYKNAALAALKGNWEQSIVAVFIIMLLSAFVNIASWGFERLLVTVVMDAEAWVLPVVVSAFILFMLCFLFILVMPVATGFINAFNRLYCSSDPNLLRNFSRLASIDISHSIGGMFMMTLVTNLFTILLIVPGFIVSFSLFLTPYLLKDYPRLSVMETLRLSKKMMKGHKMRLFKLQLSFLGWIVLSGLTFGIGMLWLIPYMMTTFAAFYQDVKAEYLMKEGLQESAL